jgi:hypothetical protein
LPLIFSHCGSSSSDPEQVQKVTITDLWATGAVDHDGDNYISSFILNFDLDINFGVERGYVLLAIRYYDVSDTATYFELFSTNEFEITEESGPWEVLVDLPAGLPPAGYDLLFLVLDSDDPERRLAESSATDRDLLRNVPLEHIDDDLLLVIEDLWMSDTSDVDGDGYLSAFRFNFNLDAPGGEKDVYGMLAARFHDPADTAAYAPYLITEDLNIVGTEFDLRSFDIVNLTPDFLQDSYDFLFIVFDASERNLRLAETSATDNPELRNVKLEPTDTDNEIYIFDASFIDSADYDGDGYNSEFTLEVDIDEMNGSGEDVYLDLFYRESGSTTYTKFGTTNSFDISGDLYDPVFIDINQNQAFSQGTYDFRVEVKFEGYDITEDWTDASIDSDLSGVKLELSSEDIAQELTVWNAWRSMVEDNDLDSFYSNVVITIDVDVSYGEADIYMKIYSKLSSESSYTQIFTTDPIHLIGDSSDDDFNLQLYVEGIAPNFWDIKFEIFFVGSNDVEITYDDTIDPDLNDIPMETVEDDTP